MIYDCFLFHGEMDCLEIRTSELNGMEVKQVIVQAVETFTGKQNRELRHLIGENIISVIATRISNNSTAWEREEYQRNGIMGGLKDVKDNDIIIISDVDEIPRALAVQEFIDKGYDFAALKMDVFWYKLNCLAEKQTWCHPKIMRYSYLKDKTPNDVRGSGFPNVIDNAGWHFSYLGDENFIVNKLESFSHQEYNTSEFKDKQGIRRKIESGMSLWGESKFEFLPLDNTFPEYVLNNQEKFKHLIHEVNSRGTLG